MTTMSNTELFGRPILEIWRYAWSIRDDDMAADLARADALLTQRREGFVAIPIWPDDALFPSFLEVFKAFEAFKPGDLFWVTRAEAVLDRARPLIEAVLWPKWIYLERALDIASRMGDLVTVALVLREMCSELTVLEGADAALSRSMKGSSKRLRTALEFVVRHLWPGIPAMAQVRKQIEWSPSSNLPEPEDLLTTYQRLCDYVHPNYGSHLAFAFPERSAVGKVLVRAVVTIYERFLARDAAKHPPALASYAMPVAMLEGPGDEQPRFVKQTLPWLGASSDQIATLLQPSVRQTFLEDAGEGILESEEIGTNLLRHIGDLWDALEPCAAPRDVRACIRFVKEHPQLASCPALADWESLLYLRRALAELETAAAAHPSGVPAAGPYDSWFQLVRASATAALDVTVTKIAGLRFACIRMLDDRNPVGATVVARAMLEQYALGVRVAERFDKAWDSVEEAARSSRDMRPPMRELEQQLGRFLAGTRGTVEEVTPWRERWAKLGWMNLRSATEEALELLPAVLYERMTRFLKNDLLGGALFLRRDQEFVKLASMMALDVLCELDPRTVAFTMTSQMANVVLTMDRVGGPMTAGDPRAFRDTVREAIVPERLVKGRDYRGMGSEVDPIRFRPGLVYYVAFGKLCEQMGIDNAARRTWFSKGTIGDVVRTGRRRCP
jgi:hypothetical protein